MQDALPSSVALRDLGVHPLKGLTRPERIFQLWSSDLPRTFPLLHEADARRRALQLREAR